ncbi:MAG: hypothetical protein K2X47_11735 [Bdellovibrionales bacterium]|nr:hypothetical protein [Bdellovibrionales bacterium]
MRFIFFTFICGLTASSAFAQTPPAAPQIPAPIIDLKPGSEVVIRWSNGNEAKLMRSALNDKVLAVPLQVTENLCVPSRTDISCFYDIAARFYQLAVVWTKHSDPVKVGKIVETDRSYPGQPIEFRPVKEDVSLFTNERAFAPIATQGMPLDHLRCDDFSWMPGVMNPSAPRAIRIIRWESELMFPNPETNVNENRPVAGFMGAQLESINDKTMVIRSVRHLTGLFSILPPVTGTASLTFALPKTSTGFTPLCQVTAKSDFALVVAMVRNLSDFNGFAPYIWGSDESAIKASRKRNSDATNFELFKALSKDGKAARDAK